jgi:uncharacterized protein DUF3631
MTNGAPNGTTPAARFLMDAVEARARKIEGTPEPPPSVGDRLMAIGLDSLPEKPDPGLIEVAMRELRAQAMGLDPINRQVMRSTAIVALKEKKVPGASALVDAAFRGLGGEGDEGRQGQALVLREPEPWAEGVDGDVLLDELTAIYRRFLVLPSGAAEAITLWTAHTYCIGAAENSPRLCVTSPTKRCGKTTLFRILEALVARPLSAANITAAALFRAVEMAHPTLVIDEADSFLKDNEELRGILNSGHSRSGAWVVRVTGEDHEPRRFSTWAAAAIALIGRLPATLEDRSIVIEMRRKAKDERVERVHRRELEALASLLRRRLVRWAKDWVDDGTLALWDPDIPESLDDRAADGWRPLLAIADAAGFAWPARAREVAVRLSAGRVEADDSVGTMLLADLRTILDRDRVDAIGTEKLIECLTLMEDRPWSDYRRGRPITPRQVATLLGSFKIKSRNLRTGSGRVLKGYQRSDAEDSFERYLTTIHPAEFATPLPPTITSSYDKSHPLPEAPGSGLKTPQVQDSEEGSGVADPKPPSVEDRGPHGFVAVEEVGEWTG